MKKTILFLAFAAAVLTACHDNTAEDIDNTVENTITTEVRSSDADSIVAGVKEGHTCLRMSPGKYDTCCMSVTKCNVVTFTCGWRKKIDRINGTVNNNKEELVVMGWDYTYEVDTPFLNSGRHVFVSRYESLCQRRVIKILK